MLDTAENRFRFAVVNLLINNVFRPSSMFVSRNSTSELIHVLLLTKSIRLEGRSDGFPA